MLHLFIFLNVNQVDLHKVKLKFIIKFMKNKLSYLNVLLQKIFLNKIMDAILNLKNILTS